MAFLFEFVREFSIDLANLAKRIEDKMFTEPHASLMQARLYSEHLVKLISNAEEMETVYPLKHAERIHKLYRQNAIEEDMYMKLEWVRKKGNKTKKAAEYEHRINKEIVYLLPNKLLTIVLHPDTAKKNFETLDEPSHSTALRRFPKGIKKGKTPTNFGYAFKFKKEEELIEFLGKLSNV